MTQSPIPVGTSLAEYTVLYDYMDVLSEMDSRHLLYYTSVVFSFASREATIGLVSSGRGKLPPGRPIQD